MGENRAIDAKLAGPLYSMTKALSMAETPLLFCSGPDRRLLVEQASAILNATVVYSSQQDFEAQLLASLLNDKYLFVVIDRPLTPVAYRLIHGYLAARDVMGADDSLLAELGVEMTAAGHRLVLLTDRATFASHPATEQRRLLELCTCIA
jgi:hypothetical protein